MMDMCQAIAEMIADGRREAGKRADAAEQRADAEHEQAEAERQRADAAEQRADAEHEQAEAERQRADAAELRADAEHAQAEVERQRADAAIGDLKQVARNLAIYGNYTVSSIAEMLSKAEAQIIEWIS